MNLDGQIRSMSRMMAKRLECALFYGKEENFKTFHRKIIKKNWFGAIYRHDLVEIRMDQLEDITLRTRISYHGVYKWLG